MCSSDQLTVQERIELLAAARDAWDRAPQNTMKAVFEWRGKKLRRLALVGSAAHSHRRGHQGLLNEMA